MDLFWNVGLPTLFAMIAAAWTYGSSEEVKRARFKGWALGKLSAVAPGVRYVLVKSVYLFVMLVSAAVVVNAVFSVIAFLTSEHPMQRKEVFFLIVQSFNGLAYSSAFFASLLLAMRKEGSDKKKHQENLILLEVDQRLVFYIAGGADLQTVAGQLMEGGIAITLTKVNSNHAAVLVDMPSLMLNRVERPLQTAKDD